MHLVDSLPWDQVHKLPFLAPPPHLLGHPVSPQHLQILHFEVIPLKGLAGGLNTAHRWQHPTQPLPSTGTVPGCIAPTAENIGRTAAARMSKEQSIGNFSSTSHAEMNGCKWTKCNGWIVHFISMPKPCWFEEQGLVLLCNLCFTGVCPEECLSGWYPTWFLLRMQSHASAFSLTYTPFFLVWSFDH